MAEIKPKAVKKGKGWSDIILKLKVGEEPLQVDYDEIDLARAAMHYQTHILKTGEWESGKDRKQRTAWVKRLK